ncbi:MAG: hypothetical protein ABIS01_07240, partial [Ferruginibacter sp.]
MKAKLLLLLILSVHAIAFAQVYQSHQLQKDRLSIQFSEGVLNIIPLSNNSIRVQWEKNLKEEREFVLVNKLPVPAFRFAEAGEELKLSTSTITVSFNKKTGAIEYSDHTGKTFLREKTGSRKLVPGFVMGQPCFVAEQSFDSPAD